MDHIRLRPPGASLLAWASLAYLKKKLQQCGLLFFFFKWRTLIIPINLKMCWVVIIFEISGSASSTSVFTKQTLERKNFTDEYLIPFVVVFFVIGFFFFFKKTALLK